MGFLKPHLVVASKQYIKGLYIKYQMFKMPDQKNQYLISQIGIFGSGQYQTRFLVARFIIQTELAVDKLQSALTNTIILSGWRDYLID